MKKILHLIWRFEGGGIESFCINLLKSVNQNEYHFDFAVCGNELPGEKEVLEYNCKIYHLPLVSGKQGKLEYLEALDNVLSKNRYDVVHSHLAFFNISTLRLAKRHNIPKRISHIHVAGYGHSNNPITLFKRWLIKRYSTNCIACSQNTADFYYGNGSKKAIVLHSGIDFSRYRKNSEKECRDNKYEVIICGRFAPEKNPSFILRVIEQILKLNSNIHFHWLGATYKEAMELINMEGYNIDTKVFMGFTPNPETSMHKASYLLMPSIKEGLGMAAIEAQVAGCFVFASDRIPKDTNLGLISYWSLELGAEVWAEKICSFIANDEIKNFKYMTKI